MGNNKPKNDLKNQRFGFLTVQEYAGRGLWTCKCDCGNVIRTSTGRLINGMRRSCDLKRCSEVHPTSLRLKPYVFYSLREYGNTVISTKTYKRLGESEILKELQEHGLKCSIRKKSRYEETYHVTQTNIIIELD